VALLRGWSLSCPAAEFHCQHICSDGQQLDPEILADRDELSWGMERSILRSPITQQPRPGGDAASPGSCVVALESRPSFGAASRSG